MKKRLFIKNLLKHALGLWRKCGWVGGWALFCFDDGFARGVFMDGCGLRARFN